LAIFFYKKLQISNVKNSWCDKNVNMNPDFYEWKETDPGRLYTNFGVPKMKIAIKTRLQGQIGLGLTTKDC
jgi:hypothetical protein